MPPTPTGPSLTDLVGEARALLLDFNGTLSDDEELLAELVGEISTRELGVPLSRERYFSDFAGETEEHMFARLAEEAGTTSPTPHELLQRFNAAYLARTGERSTISDDAREFVSRAHAQGRRLMVVTAASRDVVLPALAQAELAPLLDGVVGLEDVERSKPDPEAYLRALDALGIEAADAVAFEDSRTGIAAALGAGIATVGIRGSLDDDTIEALTPYSTERLEPGLLGED